MVMKKKNSSVYNYKSKKKNKLLNEYIENNKNCNELILNKIQKRKELIHKEILNLINKNLENIEKKINTDNFNSEGIININTSRSQDKDNFQNYSGEKISIVNFSNTQTIDKEKDNKNNNDIVKKNENNPVKKNLFLNNEKIKKKKKENNQEIKNIILNHNKKNKKICRNNYNLKKLKISEIILNNNINDGIETKTDLETLNNISNFEEINDNDEESSLKIKNNNSKEENEDDINLTRRKDNNKIRNICIYDYSAKLNKKNNIILNDNYKSKKHFNDNKKGLMSSNFSLFESTSTSNTYKKSKNQFKFHQSIDDAYNINLYLKYNKTELINFFSEINLPTIYADKFIDNGFDDLDVIISLTKTSIAITNQNLKDIGIMYPGHRAKILIHLEERAELFPFYLEKHIIYNNKINTNNTYSNIDTLSKFLNGIGCERYINNFRRNGYFNSELLFTQMITREPITKLMLYEDFCIDTEIIISKIIKCLNIESRNYIKSLRSKKKINDIYDDKIYHNSCEPCLIF